MTRILFAKTRWGYPVLAISGNVECLEREIEQGGSDMDDLGINLDFMAMYSPGIYVWAGEYLWGDEWGPQVKNRSIWIAAVKDILEFKVRLTVEEDE